LRRRRAALALLAALLTTQTGCTGHSSEAAADGSGCVSGDDARRAAQSLLDRRTAAFRGGDLEAFLATVDATETELYGEQRAWFSRVQQLPEHTFELTLSVNQGTSDDSLTSYVNQDVQLAGIDEKSVGVVHLVTFERRDGCWLVAADEPDLLNVALAPWDAPGSYVVHRDGVVLVTDESTEDERERLLDEAVSAWQVERRLLAFVNRRPDDAGVVVLAFTTDEAMKANGFYHQSLDLTGGVELPIKAGPDDVDYRVLVAPAMLDVGVASGLPAVLRHEFVHVLLARHPLATTWAVEGVAEYYASGEGGGPTAPIEQLVPAGSSTGGAGIPEEEFYADTWAALAGNYAVAWAAMTYLGDEYGKDEPARLVKALHRAKGYYFPKRVERILGERYGLTSDELGARARELIADRV
jgi:hypothetical protein